MLNVQLEQERLKGDFKGKLLTDKDYDQIFEGNVTVYDKSGGLLMVLLKNPVDKKNLVKAWTALRECNLETSNRGTASGEKSVLRKRKDGKASKTRQVARGLEVISGVVGYYPRYPRIPFCRQCAWNQQNPEKFEATLPLIQEVSKLHKRFCGDAYARQEAVVNKTSKDFIIKDTIYSTVTVNKNFRTAAHLDAKNLQEGMCAMMLIREGKYLGGNVVFPEFRIAAKMDTGDLIFFRNMQDYHGNTPIVPLTKKYTRCTLVFYYREEMVKCGSAPQELERAKMNLDYGKDFSEERED